MDEKKAADALFLRSLPPYVPDFTKAFDYICVHTGGRAVIDAMVKDGAIETRPGDDDPGAIALMHRLAENSRKRWPDWAQPAAKVGISTEPAG